jgi:ribosomal protein L3 glutamine methyltransferase
LHYDGLETLQDFIRWGGCLFIEHDLFFGHGTDNGFDEAKLLACHALHLPWDASPAFLNARLTLDERDRVRNLFKQRILTRKPAAYLTGEAMFAGLNFYVNEDTLVPRSPIAELIVQGFAPWVEPDSVERVLDLCTGSGCIALALKSKWTQAAVSGVDVSIEALQLAQKNAESLNLSVSWLKEDVLQPADASVLKTQKWDVIVSNPPYIPEKDKSMMASNVLDFEPHLALFVDNKQPIIFYQRIIEFAKCQLKNDGILAFELHENLAKEVKEACSQNGFSAVEIFEDLQGKPRMLVARI